MDTNEKPFPIITERFAVDQKNFDKVWDLRAPEVTTFTWRDLEIEVGQAVFEIAKQRDEDSWRIFWYSPLEGRRTTFTLKELVDMFNLLSETTRLRIDLVVV